MHVEQISYRQALADTAEQSRHLLLGNGFTSSIQPQFGYASLFAEAVRKDPSLPALFSGCGTNFEAAMLKGSLSDRLRIRRAFVDAIVWLHPRRMSITPSQLESCGRFLATFAGLDRGRNRGRVFTTNYDLVAYWALMRAKEALKIYDGFDVNGEWESTRGDNTFIFYLHGALHLFREAAPSGRNSIYFKLLYSPRATLIEQIRERVGQQFKLPIFVSEGASADKTSFIAGNLYLRKSLDRFEMYCGEEGAAVFTVGHSLSAHDRHLTDIIGTKARSVYVGVFNAEDAARADELAAQWALRTPSISVKTFDVRECAIWGLDDGRRAAPPNVA